MILPPALESPMQRPLLVRPKLLDGPDIVPVFNQYVGVGDMVAATEVAAMPAKRNRVVGSATHQRTPYRRVAEPPDHGNAEEFALPVSTAM